MICLVDRLPRNLLERSCLLSAGSLVRRTIEERCRLVVEVGLDLAYTHIAAGDRRDAAEQNGSWIV